MFKLCVSTINTEPKIVTSRSLKNRSYIMYYSDGIRYRLYSGANLNIQIYPNKATSVAERSKLLSKLLFEINKTFETGYAPQSDTKIEPIKVQRATIFKTTEQAFRDVEHAKMTSPLSYDYKKELKRVVDDFLKFLTKDEKSDDIKNLEQQRVEDFLNQYKATITYYMGRRRMLSVFFAEFIRKKLATDNLSKNAPRLKTKAALHKIYTKEQLTTILQFLRANNEDLYICCLLAYCCMLRPHQEIRLLKRKHFNDSFLLISLSGAENKSGRVRVVSIPEYLQPLIKQRLSLVHDPEINLFTLTHSTYNDYYFNLIWSRLKPAMYSKGILQKDQTIYSFRHTAAVDVYNRTKDIHIIQQLMGHSTMIVTLNYLRGLGELNSQQLKDALPVLELT
jgi:integrase